MQQTVSNALKIAIIVSVLFIFTCLVCVGIFTWMHRRQAKRKQALMNEPKQKIHGQTASEVDVESAISVSSLRSRPVTEKAFEMEFPPKPSIESATDGSHVMSV